MKQFFRSSKTKKIHSVVARVPSRIDSEIAVGDCGRYTPATFAVRVQPRAKLNTVTGDLKSGFKVYVTAPPEAGRANEAVVELLAEHLGVKRRQIEIISGAKNRNKVVRVRERL